MRLDWLQPKVHHHPLLADAQAVGLFFFVYRHDRHVHQQRIISSLP